MHGYNIQIHPPINEVGPWRSVLHDEAGKFLSSTTAPTPHGALEMLVPRIADEEDVRSGQPEPDDEAVFDALAEPKLDAAQRRLARQQRGQIAFARTVRPHHRPLLASAEPPSFARERAARPAPPLEHHRCV